jgi:thiamine-phosphate pyrophosphorylase
VSFVLPKVYPITDAGLTGLSHAAQVRRLAQGGASFVQLREKTAPGREFYESAKAAVVAAHECGVKLIINDRADIAAAVGADGVHLGQDDLPVNAARELLGTDAIIGLSTHNPSQAAAALGLAINYLAFGPVFSTYTKDNPAPEVGLNGLSVVRKKTGNFPIVAIGGITEQNAIDVIQAGANSVAVISALLSDSKEITHKTSTLLRLLSDV